MAESIIRCTFLRNGKEVTEETTTCCFTGREDLISVELPDNFTWISDEEFMGCKNLTSITAKGVRHLGNYAFSGCESLAEVNFTLEKIDWVGNGVFEDCVKMPKNVFDRCIAIMAMLRNSNPEYDGIIDD